MKICRLWQKQKRLSAIAVLSMISCAHAQERFALVNIKSVDPSIAVELRYATSKNIAGHSFYSPKTPALVRPEVAERLARVQKFLRRYQYSLKIWDAYRPPSVHAELWRAVARNAYVANPHLGAGSMHSWGVAVDVTLLDSDNRPASMPTDFDNFTPAAMWLYQGRDPAVHRHLHLLQVAMCNAGFYELPSEWWHFTIDNWDKLLPRDEVKRAVASLRKKSERKS
jgi:zinc D-Ala-D-Ala dipeptidase